MRCQGAHLFARTNGGSFTDPVGCYTDILAADPGNYSALIGRSKALLDMGNLPEAERDAIRAIRVDRSQHTGYLRLGAVFAALGRERSAEGQYRMALALDPSNIRIQMLGSRSYQARRGSPQPLVIPGEIYGGVGRRFPGTFSSWQRRKELADLMLRMAGKVMGSGSAPMTAARKQQGRRTFSDGGLDDAAAWYEGALRLDLTHVNSLAAAMLKQGLYKKVIEVCWQGLMEARGASPEMTAMIYRRLGTAQLNLGLVEQAVESFGKSILGVKDPALRQEVGRIRALVNRKAEIEYLNPELGMIAKKNGDAMLHQHFFEHSLSFYVDAMRMNPKDGELHVRMASALSSLRRNEEGLKECEIALRSCGNDIMSKIEAMRIKANCLVQLNGLEQAQVVLTTVLRVIPDDQRSLEQLAMINHTLAARNAQANDWMMEGGPAQSMMAHRRQIVGSDRVEPNTGRHPNVQISVKPSGTEQNRREAMGPQPPQHGQVDLLQNPLAIEILESMQNDPDSIQMRAASDPYYAEMVENLGQSGLLSWFN